MQTRPVEKIKIGTRGSPLALKQTDMVSQALRAVRPDLEIAVEIIKTSGDWKPSDGEVPLSAQNGGKAQFAKEIEAAMLRGDIDIAVHSMKDMESFLHDDLVIPWMLPREDARDALICGDLAKNSQKIHDLPMGCRVGSASVRRGAFIRALRPDLKVEPFRGNVQTRLQKLKSGQVDVTLLAVAGLNRLGIANEMSAIIPVEDMLPACAQGAVGIELRKDMLDELSFIGQISCEKTVACVSAEREVLRALVGSCHTPVGAYAIWDGNEIFLRAQVCSLDGQRSFKAEGRKVITEPGDAVALGADIGQALKQKTPDDVLAEIMG
tara:strand:+ start:1675 stop:2643 length:969 start_codon:yes stop_codon:yes gene_type:complete